MNPLSPLLSQYADAFSRCYPGKKIEFRKRGANHYVVIDGDKGEAPMSDAELKFAIQNFNHGKMVK